MWRPTVPWRSSPGYERCGVASVSLIGLGMTPLQPFNALRINFDLGLAQQLVGEQASLMPILRWMRQTRVHALGIECNLPAENLLIDAGSQRAVQVEQKDHR
jgi:hypothetical protein